MKLSVVIPARNEAETIERTLLEITDNLDRKEIDYEVIVVDDASSDGTGAVVQRIADRTARVRCLRSHFSDGFGFAVRAGLAAFEGDAVAIVMADGSDSPDVVVRPGSHDEVQAVIDWCVERHVALVPFGGGTSVVGGLAARRDGYTGVVSLDLGRLDRLLHVDTDSMTAVLEPGVRGPDAESMLAQHGLTIGHFPQSFEYASIGGFAVTRSSGQSSAGYGRFDSLVVGLTVATPLGRLDLGSLVSRHIGLDEVNDGIAGLGRAEGTRTVIV